MKKRNPRPFYIAFLYVLYSLGCLCIMARSFYMKEIPLTRGLFAQVSDEDFEEFNKHKWHAALCDGRFYAARSGKKTEEKAGKRLYMHREILGLNKWGDYGDHIDHDTLNNQRSNLRKATAQENVRNTSVKKNGSSKHLGVRFCKKAKKFVAVITVNRKRIYLGSYLLEDDAGMAYNWAAAKYYGDFANFNKINGEILYKEPRTGGLNMLNTSGFRGVTSCSRSEKWLAQIQKSGKHFHLGRYDSKEDAARAYNEKAIELYGEKAILNIIPPNVQKLSKEKATQPGGQSS